MASRDNIYIFFDAVGTLIHADPVVIQVYKKFGDKHGHHITEDEIEKRFYTAYNKHFCTTDKENITSEEIERNRWANVVNDVFKKPSEALFRELWAHFSFPRSWRKNTDISDLIPELIDAGMHVCIASNFDARLIRICSYHFPLININHIFYSSNIGYSKPDIRFYKTIQKMIGLNNLEYIMIGDDPVRDIEASKKAGWQAYDIANTRNGLMHLLK